MELHTLLTILHIASGTAALLSGTAAVWLRHRARLHGKTGLVFSGSMLLVAFSAISITLIPGHDNDFLLSVGVFSAYLVLSGYRSAPARLYRYRRADFFISAGMTLFGLYLAGSGIRQLLTLQEKTGSLIPFAFGILALFMVWQDMQWYRKPGNALQLQARHLTRMIAGLIAAYTAFLVVNNHWLPPVVAWLGPSVPGTWLIIRERKKLRV